MPFSAPLLKTLLTAGWDPKFRATLTYVKGVFDKITGLIGSRVNFYVN